MIFLITESQHKFLLEQTQPTLDRTKPVDFYFGTAIFRAPNSDIALRFANKLAIHGYNSNVVHVLKDKTNERWFVGPNNKIYLNQKKYDEDPNKNWWADPIQMGLIRL